MKVSPRSTARSRSLSVYREPGHNGRDRHGAHRRRPNPATSSRTTAAAPRNVLEYFMPPFALRTNKKRPERPPHWLATFLFRRRRGGSAGTLLSPFPALLAL